MAAALQRRITSPSQLHAERRQCPVCSHCHVPSCGKRRNPPPEKRTLLLLWATNRQERDNCGTKESEREAQHQGKPSRRRREGGAGEGGASGQGAQAANHHRRSGRRHHRRASGNRRLRHLWSHSQERRGEEHHRGAGIPAAAKGRDQAIGGRRQGRHPHLQRRLWQEGVRRPHRRRVHGSAVPRLRRVQPPDRSHADLAGGRGPDQPGDPPDVVHGRILDRRIFQPRHRRHPVHRQQ